MNSSKYLLPKHNRLHYLFLPSNEFPLCFNTLKFKLVNFDKNCYIKMYNWIWFWYPANWRNIYQIKVSTNTCHLWKRGRLGWDITEDTEDHVTEEEKVAPSSYASQYDESQSCIVALVIWPDTVERIGDLNTPEKEKRKVWLDKMGKGRYLLLLDLRFTFLS